MTVPDADLLAVLRRPSTIRARCAAITRAVADDRSGYFRLDRSRLDDAAARVETLLRTRFPDLKVPPHSRWRHFEAGGVDRRAELDTLLAGRSPAERVRAQFDLATISVLLDAGAGARWRYREQPGGVDPAALPAGRHDRDELQALLDRAATRPAASPEPPEPASAAGYSRSEGLAVATFRGFVAGAFSSTAGDPLRVDAAALRQIDAAVLRALFQTGPDNPLVGLEGRAALLSRLGQTLQAEAARTGLQARPALLFDRLAGTGLPASISAVALLEGLLSTLAPIWASGSVIRGVPAGDIWPHRWAGAATASGDDPGTSGWVPFHKLSQWLTYSLVEPLQWAGVEVHDLDGLTGLPEYRNGGLLLDCGVIVPRSPRVLARPLKPGEEPVVEWRALTVTLLDELAERVRQRLGLDASQLPLASILEGGTWAAGRQIAQELRGGAPPIVIDSDGTLF